MELLNKGEKRVLHSIAVDGPGNMQNVSKRANISYPTVHRSIKTLKKYGFIRLSEIGDNGPKAAQTYSLEPIGTLASIVLLYPTLDLDKLLSYYGSTTPKVVWHWDAFIKAGFEKELQEVSNKILLEWAILRLEYQIKGVSSGGGLLYCNILEEEILRHCYKVISVEKYEKFLDVITKDNEYLEIWDNWLDGEIFLVNILRRYKKGFTYLNRKETMERKRVWQNGGKAHYARC